MAQPSSVNDRFAAIEVDIRINVGVVLSILLVRRVGLMYAPLDTLSPFLYNSYYGRAR